MKQEKNKAAVELGKLAAKKNKEKGSEYFKELSDKGIEARKNGEKARIEAIKEHWKQWRLKRGDKLRRTGPISIGTRYSR